MLQKLENRWTDSTVLSVLLWMHIQIISKTHSVYENSDY